jgi:SAM-dependent methyltransferase
MNEASVTLRHRAAHWTRLAYLWACHRLYNEFARVYDPVSRLVSGGRWAAWRRVALDYVAGPCVLEVGFGTGELLLEMADRPWRVVGLEYSAAMQQVTAEKLRRRGVELSRVRARAQQLPFADGVFDTILAAFPAEYITDPTTLHEAARVLRPGSPEAAGGRLIVVGLRVYWQRQKAGGEQLPHDEAFTRFREAISAAGLKVGVEMRDAGRVRLPVVVAERRDDA